MKLWIDTDAGVDDSTAILLALNAPNVEIVGISCVGGNAHLENVINNVNRTLHVYGVGGQIPIYGGCRRALVHPNMVIPEIHGHDGLGDINNADFGLEGKPERLDPDHAVNALIAAAEKYGSDLVLLTLGPLTNIAIAFRMNEAAMMRIGRIIVMGGAEDGRGNTSPFAEFNIRCDPEAAEILFQTYPQSQTMLASWTLTQKYNFTGADKEAIAGRGDTVLARWVRDTWKAVLDFTKGDLLMADPLAAYVCCYDGAITEERKMRLSVVLSGEKIGMTEAKDDDSGVRVVTAIDANGFKKAMSDLMSHH